MKLGEFPDMGIADARVEFGYWQKQHRDGHDPKFVREQQHKSQAATAAASRAENQEKAFTVDVLVQDYLDAISNTHKTWRMVAHHLEKEVSPVMGKRPVVAISKSDCIALLDRIAASGKPIARNRTHQWARACWNWALQREKVGRNPWSGVKMLPERPRERVLRDSELRQFITWLPNSTTGKHIKDVLWLILLTACRPGEICSMRSEYVNQEDRIITLPITKNQTQHEIYLSNQAWDLLEPRLELGEWCFPNSTGRHTLSSTVAAQLNRRVRSELSALPPFTPHDLRRTCATWLGEQPDCPPGVIERILNHQPPANSVTRRHYNLAKLNKPAAEWWQKWADHVFGLLTS